MDKADPAEWSFRVSCRVQLQIAWQLTYIYIMMASARIWNFGRVQFLIVQNFFQSLHSTYTNVPKLG
jgi:hypothetical protein